MLGQKVADNLERELGTGLKRTFAASLRILNCIGQVIDNQGKVDSLI